MAGPRFMLLERTEDLPRKSVPPGTQVVVRGDDLDEISDLIDAKRGEQYDDPFERRKNDG